ncbi:hypothetical protein COO91_02019 [Nostoc flagelliforme CCNUN1]|uniref:Uncharacterized protein n=1 Tax=Nostoc flagelliforme CCNUN1 TaxID=2038116 RepID=A0A2K8SL36_9NOSO|nr:hypothetical protein [Nostoc flagelliforme]AUB36118.1 hypothetical protein COO91_02019 [Nostoc flagelliforme CCNUN1]
MSLAEKLYQSVVEALKNHGGEDVPSWEEMPPEFKNKFEAEVNEGTAKLLKRSGTLPMQGGASSSGRFTVSEKM